MSRDNAHSDGSIYIYIYILYMSFLLPTTFLLLVTALPRVCSACSLALGTQITNGLATQS